LYIKKEVKRFCAGIRSPRGASRREKGERKNNKAKQKHRRGEKKVKWQKTANERLGRTWKIAPSLLQTRKGNLAQGGKSTVVKHWHRKEYQLRGFPTRGRKKSRKKERWWGLTSGFQKEGEKMHNSEKHPEKSTEFGLLAHPKKKE